MLELGVSLQRVVFVFVFVFAFVFVFVSDINDA